MTKTEACWDRTEGCCMTDAFERGITQDEAYAALDRHNAEHHPTFARTTKDAP